MKPKKKTPKQLKKIADGLWGQIILKLYPRCVCGRPSHDPHHVVPKSISALLRHEIKNGIGTCRGCHININDPETVAKILKAKGEKVMNYLFKIKRQTAGYLGVKYYEEVIKNLKEEE